MLNLQEVKKAVDHLSPEELRELREYLENRAVQLQPKHPLPPEERIRRLSAAAKAIRAGFTAEEWDAVEQAINVENSAPNWATELFTQLDAIEADDLIERPD